MKECYQALDKLRLPDHMYLASPSSDYRFVWIRDCVYMSLPYLNKQDSQYEKTYHRLFDLFLEYEWKLDIACRQKPVWEWEYLHARYTPEGKEIHHQSWGHAQHDMIGAFLFGVGEGLNAGKKMLRSEHDRRIVQKLVRYLENVGYWCDPDNGMWEEGREVHASSVGACVAGLKAVAEYVDVPDSLVLNGLKTVYGLFPRESVGKRCDLAQLSLVYPYRLFSGVSGDMIVEQIESLLLRSRGVARYLGDSYYSTLEAEHGRMHPPEFYYGSEAEWTFGMPWLALCRLELGDSAKAYDYVARTETVMTAPGILPELYYAGSDNPNPNAPLGWSVAMYIVAKEAVSGLGSQISRAAV